MSRSIGLTEDLDSDSWSVPRNNRRQAVTQGGGRKGQGEGGFKESESALPSKYANIDSSGLKFTVQGPGANDFKADLKD